jgi:hypothetical protein
LNACRQDIREFLRRAEARRPSLDGEALVVLAHHRVMSGLLEHGTAPSAIPVVRAGVDEFCAALETGFVAGLAETRGVLLTALAAGDWASAQFIAALPPEHWRSAPRPGMSWLSDEVAGLLSLLNHRDAAARPRIESFRRAVFEDAMAEGLREDVPGIRAECRLLEALAARSSESFRAALTERLGILEASFRRWGRHSPYHLADLEGLGFCRLARDRAMIVDARSPYLPLDWLDVR